MYDILRKHNFQMKATLIWTINDFLMYKMVYGQSTTGKLACSYCMKNNKAFTLTNDGKTSFLLSSKVFSNQSVRGTYLTKIKFRHAHNYVLLNCDELKSFIQ